MASLEIRNLHAKIEDKPILRGVDLTINQGEVHALMGLNGSGKSTLAYVLAGHPSYEVTEGEVLLDGENILELEPDERAHKGLFLAFQYPTAIPGVNVANFLRTSVNAVQKGRFLAEHPDAEYKAPPVAEFRKRLTAQMNTLKMDRSFMARYLNEGFSGGEKKRMEIVQMAMLEPRFAVMDETDSGLDIDALRIVADGVNALLGPNLGVLVITHYQRLLNYIKPQFVHIMMNGRIVANGGPELAVELDTKGYDWIRQEFAPDESLTPEEEREIVAPALTASQQSVTGRPAINVSNASQ
ncbi:MAG: Fe-S cluster assembly ATPase SufC [Chloroflexota bacterium]|nr:Fe-S cluster assembly ATPase SufC [Chloroflexota bacterium]